MKADTQSAVMDCYSAAGLEVGLGLACFKSSLPKNGWKSALATEMPKAFKDPFLAGKMKPIFKLAAMCRNASKH